MKALLLATALIEAPTGLALLVAPAGLAPSLLGTTLDIPAANVVGRLTGAALVSLAIACALLAPEGSSPAARKMVAAMLFYNAGAAAILAHAGLGLGLTGMGLWPAVLLHAAMSLWCVVSLRPTSR